MTEGTESSDAGGASDPNQQETLTDAGHSLRGEGEAFGLPSVDGWQQIQFSSASELTLSGATALQPVPIGLQDPIPTGIQLDPDTIRRWNDAQSAGEAGPDQYGFWLHADGRMLVGSPTDPFAADQSVAEAASPTGADPAAEAVPIEHQVGPLMAAGGVEDGVLAGDAGSDPMAEPIVPAEEVPSKNGCGPAMIIGAAALVAAAAALVVFGIGLFGGSSGVTGTADQIAADADEGSAADASSVEPGAESDDAESSGEGTSGEENAAGASATSEPISFTADGVGDFLAVSADAAAAAAADGSMIVADGDSPTDGPVEVVEVSVDVTGSMIEAAVTIGEAEGPFGVGLVLATDDGVVVATNTVQAMGGPDGVEQLGQVTAVQSGGFETELEELTLVASFGEVEPGAGNSIRLSWDLLGTGVPPSWQYLFHPNLKLWLVVDGAPPRVAEFDQIAHLRSALLVSTVYFEASKVFPPDESLTPTTLTEFRTDGFVRAGLPQETADCLAEDVSLRSELLASFRPEAQEPLLMPCLLRTQFFTSVAAEGLQSYVFDGTLDIDCLSDGMAVHIPDVATYVAFATADYNQWPAGLVEAYAEVLEVCVPLEPFYMAQFGQYNFTDPGCPATMTSHVLTAYGWLRFIQEGILSPDPAVQAAGQGRFDQHVNEGYGIYTCVVDA